MPTRTNISPLDPLRREYKCALTAAICFVICWVWPVSAPASAIVAFIAFSVFLLPRGQSSLRNLTFIFTSVTLIILLSETALWTTLRSGANLNLDGSVGSIEWVRQYIGMAIIALILGACFVSSRSHDGLSTGSRFLVHIRCPWVYLSAALVPLALNVILYFFSLRGLDYVEIHRAGLGPQKYILFLVYITHGAFIRLFAGWVSLPKSVRLIAVSAICLFVYIYSFLMPLRTHLFIFGMYTLYFFGSRIRWYNKLAVLVTALVLLSWIAMNRGGMDDSLKGMGLVQGTVTAMSFGTGMVEMVPWAEDIERSEGLDLGKTYILELVNSPNVPSVRYVRETAPQYAEAGGGFGFFYLAELLWNFGRWGGLIAACLLGAALQKLSTMHAAAVQSTVLPALLGASFPLIRNDLMSTLKMPIYIIVSCFILDRIVRLSVYMGKLSELNDLSKTTEPRRLA
jgi:hypothetical protein